MTNKLQLFSVMCVCNLQCY